MAKDLFFARAVKQGLVVIDPERCAVICTEALAKVRQHRGQHPVEIDLPVLRIGYVHMAAPHAGTRGDIATRDAAITVFRATYDSIHGLAPVKGEEAEG